MKKTISILFMLIILGCEGNNNEGTSQSLVFISSTAKVPSGLPKPGSKNPA